MLIRIECLYGMEDLLSRYLESSGRRTYAYSVENTGVTFYGLIKIIESSRLTKEKYC